MATVIFNSDNSVQGTITSITSTPLGINIYAYNTNLSSLSTFSKLNIDNLNITSTSLLGNINSLSTFSKLNIDNLNITSTSLLGNINSLSTFSKLNIDNLNITSTSLLGNINSLSTFSKLNIDNLNITSTSLLGNINSLSTFSKLNIDNLNITSTSLLGNINSLSTFSKLNIDNLNTTKQNNLTFNYPLLNSSNTISLKYDNTKLKIDALGKLTIIDENKTNFSNLVVSNASSFLSSLNVSGFTSLYNNVTIISSLNISGNTTLDNITTINSSLTVSGNTTLNNATTINSSLNVVGNVIGSGTALTNLNYNSILNPPSIISFNNPGTFISTLNISGNATLNNITTINSSLTVSGKTFLNNATTINSSLNVKGKVTIEGINVVDKSTYTNQYQLFINPGTSTTNSTFQTIQQNVGYNQILDLQPNGGSIKLSQNTTALSNLNVSGITTLSNNVISTGYIYAGGSTTGLRINGNDYGNTIYQNATTIGGNPANIGFTLRDNNTFNFYAFSTAGVYTNLMNMNMNGIALNKDSKCSGSFGINATNLLSRLTVRMSYSDGNTGGICIDSADTTNTYNLRIFSYVQAGSQVGYNFQVNNIASSVNAITLNYDGGVNIGNYLRIAGKSVYNNLFNSSGFGHGTLTNFNSITDFGYRFINDPATNGPGTPSNPVNQYYTWMIGLGTDNNYDSFGAQFALPRNMEQPVLSVRYRDNYVWGGWTGITATTLKGSATINAGEWLRSSDTSSTRLFFAANGTTYYQGFNSNGTYNHEWRNSGGTNTMGLNEAGSLYVANQITCKFYTIPSSNTDYIGVNANTGSGSNGNYTMYVLYGTFTAFHRSFLDNEQLFDIENPQKFKDDYVGRIVIASGKIATDTKLNEEWEIKYDKDGISIEDAVPMIQLSRNKKDKRVFGVLGDPKRQNSRQERMIVNSVGEGGIMVINSNGNIENGDYITSSDYLGYGEKQDEIFLANYTVGKATIDCNFELENPYYNCFELEGTNYRIAFIAATYHCA